MTDEPDSSYRISLSTAEVEATLATLFAVADLLTQAETDEDSTFARAVNALRLSPRLLQSASDRICEEVPDFLSIRAEKEAERLTACLGPARLTATDSKRQLLEEALAAQIPVEIEYYVPSRKETTRRIVDVQDVYDESGGAYLSGYCHLRRDHRVFKLENIRAVRKVSPDDAENMADPFADE